MEIPQHNKETKLTTQFKLLRILSGPVEHTADYKISFPLAVSFSA